MSIEWGVGGVNGCVLSCEVRQLTETSGWWVVTIGFSHQLILCLLKLGCDVLDNLLSILAVG